MPFVPGDVNINRNGRPKIDANAKPVTNRDLRKRELLMLLRKLKPHVASAIMKAADILDNKQAAHASQLVAAKMILEHYRRLTLDLYGDDVDPEEEGTEIQQENRPLFSLSVVNNETDTKE